MKPGLGIVQWGVGWSGTYIQIPGMTIAQVWSTVCSMGKSRARRTPLVIHVLLFLSALPPLITEPRSSGLGSYSQRAHPKNTYQPHLLRPWHLQPNHHRHRQNQQQDIRSHIQHRRRHVKRRSVNAASFGNGNVPVPSERRTGEDERKDERDAVSDDEKYTCVDT